MNIENVHPMVMKAARAQNAIAARMTGMDPEQSWLIYQECHIKDATEMLTACGALECLSALERMTYKDNFGAYRALIVAGSHSPREVESAFAKVYGSAPE